MRCTARFPIASDSLARLQEYAAEQSEKFAELREQAAERLHEYADYQAERLAELREQAARSLRSYVSRPLK